MARVSDNVDFDHVTTPVNQENFDCEWGGRIIRLLSKAIHVIYDQIVEKLSKLASLVPIHREGIKSYQRTDQTSFSVNFNKGEPKVEVDLKQKIQVSEKEFIHEEEALHYILRLRIRETISHSRQLILMLNERIPQEYQNSVANETKKLMDYFEAEEHKLDKEMSKEEIHGHIQDLFNHIQAYYQLQRTIGLQLPKGSNERKKFNKAATLLTTEVKRQQEKYQIPSSDSYLNELRRNCKLALQKLESLKSLSIPTV